MIRDMNREIKKDTVDLESSLQKDKETAISIRNTLDVLADIEQSNKKELNLY